MNHVNYEVKYNIDISPYNNDIAYCMCISTKPNDTGQKIYQINGCINMGFKSYTPENISNKYTNSCYSLQRINNWVYDEPFNMAIAPNMFCYKNSHMSIFGKSTINNHVIDIQYELPVTHNDIKYLHKEFKKFFTEVINHIYYRLIMFELLDYHKKLLESI